MNQAPALETSVEIAAPPARVWELVHDPTRMTEWSPQVASVRLRAETPAVGVRFTNRNRDGELEWTTHGEIVRYVAERELAYRIEENWVVWSLRLEPTATGTRLTQRRETPDGISDLSRELTEGFMGGQATFTETMRTGMAQTLAHTKAAAEA